MNRKQALKERQLKKKQEKEQREIIINSYIDKIKILLDEAYLEMATIVEDFNKQILESTLRYEEIKSGMIAAIKQNDIDDSFEKLARTAIDFEIKNTELYLAITSDNIEENKILKELSKVANNVFKVIEEAKTDLHGMKNDYYMLSIITSRSYKKFEEYNEYIIDIALESNEYIDNYVDARDKFIDFITELKEASDASFNKRAIKEIDDNIKFKERLRISYYEMENFLKYKGYEPIRQGNTTHAIWKNKITGTSIPVPNKSRTMPQGTVSKILRMIGSNRQELANFLYE